MPVREKEPGGERPAAEAVQRLVGVAGLGPQALGEVRACLQGAGLGLREVPAGGIPEDLDLLVAAVDDEAGIQKLLDFRRSHPASGAVALVTRGIEMIPGGLDAAAEVQIVGAAGRIDGAYLQGTLESLAGGRASGIRRHLGEPAPVLRISLERSDLRGAYLEAAGAFLRTAGAPGLAVEDVLVAADELITNAFFDAPVDPEGRRLYDRICRKEPIVLGAAAARLAVAWDGRQAAVSVADPFGSLEPGTIGKALGRCFRMGPDQILRAPGGANMGLYTAYSVGAAMVVDIDPGRRTEITVLVHRSPRSCPVRSLGIFHQEPNRLSADTF